MLYSILGIFLMIIAAINGVVKKIANLIGSIIILLALLELTGIRIIDVYEPSIKTSIIEMIIGALIIIAPQIVDQLTINIHRAFGFFLDLLDEKRLRKEQ